MYFQIWRHFDSLRLQKRVFAVDPEKGMSYDCHIHSLSKQMTFCFFQRDCSFSRFVGAQGLGLSLPIKKSPPIGSATTTIHQLKLPGLRKYKTDDFLAHFFLKSMWLFMDHVFPWFFDSTSLKQTNQRFCASNIRVLNCGAVLGLGPQWWWHFELPRDADFTAKPGTKVVGRTATTALLCCWCDAWFCWIKGAWDVFLCIFPWRMRNTRFFGVGKVKVTNLDSGWTVVKRGVLKLLTNHWLMLKTWALTKRDQNPPAV